MKRFHVHVGVTDLDASIEFYNRLFGQSPAKRKDDYAKWMLDDPAINFAISTRAGRVGVDHFGMQAGDETELVEIRDRAQAAANGKAVEQSGTCCYADSEKYWTVDPGGIAWEHYLTLSDQPVYGDALREDNAAACCIPLGPGAAADSDCCVPLEQSDAQDQKSAGSCCG